MNILEGRVLGVIGGMGPLATNLFYNMVIEKTDAESDQEHINMIILNHATMPDRTEAIKAGHEDEIFHKLLKDAQFLEESGACCIAVPCNTSHFILGKVQENISVPVINMIKGAAEDAKNAVKGIKSPKIGIMATDGTIKIGLYQRELNAVGLEPVIPTLTNQEKVMKIIYDGIKKGEPVNSGDFKEIEREFREMGCHKVILACTELSVYKIQENLSDYYIDAMESLADRAIAMCGK